jgi:hypothetical protein
VKLLAAASEQATIGDLLYERMLEGIGRLGCHATRKDQFCPDQFAEGGRKRCLIYPGDGSEQLVVKLPSDDGSDLRDLLHRRQPVEPGQQ